MSDTIFDQIGGASAITALVDAFYQNVAADPLLRPMYPEDLTESRHHMEGFLTQLWGGPLTYIEERGHPRLRMRHFPFSIGSAERDAWLRAMVAAVRDANFDETITISMLDYFRNAAHHMVNRED